MMGFGFGAASGAEFGAAPGLAFQAIPTGLFLLLLYQIVLGELHLGGYPIKFAFGVVVAVIKPVDGVLGSVKDGSVVNLEGGGWPRGTNPAAIVPLDS